MCCQISKCTWSSIRVSLLFIDKDEEKDSTQLVTWRFDCSALCFPLLYLWLLSLCRGLRLAASLSEPQLRWDMAKGYSEVKLISMPHCFSFQLGTMKECKPISTEFYRVTVALLHCPPQFCSAAPGARCKKRFHKIHTAHVSDLQHGTASFPGAYQTEQSRKSYTRLGLLSLMRTLADKLDESWWLEILCKATYTIPPLRSTGST